MSALRLSPAAIHTFPSSSSSSSSPKLPPISSSLRPSPSPLRRLPFPSLKTPFPRRRRLPSGGSAAGATMADSPSSSYASALSQVAQSNNTLDATLSDLEIIATIFSEPSLPSFFSNPTISDQKKLDLIAEIANSSDLQPHTVNFLNILIDMKRIDLIQEIVREFEFCYNEITGTEVAVVSSVVKLESQHLAQIAKTVQRLTGARNVRIKTAIDASLVAGFTIRYGNSGSKLIDMSVKKQLDEIAAQLDFSSVVIA